MMRKIYCLTLFVAQIICGITSADELAKVWAKDRSEANSMGDAKLSYDSRLCRQKANGMVYFAAGQVVFKVPQTSLLYIRGMDDQERASLPKRRHPSEPEGCPDNPLWGGSFKVKFDDILSENGSDRSDAVVNIVARRPDEVGQYDRAYSEFEYLQSNHSERCRNDLGSFIVCKYPSKKHSASDELDFAVYQAKSAGYRAPNGLPFSISCSSLRKLNDEERECSVSYNLDHNISIFYSFYRSEVSIDSVIDYDMTLRALISAAIVRDYRW